MVPLLILSLKPPKARSEHITWPMWLTVVVFFLIGAYGGAFRRAWGSCWCWRCRTPAWTW